MTRYTLDLSFLIFMLFVCGILKGKLRSYLYIDCHMN